MPINPIQTGKEVIDQYGRYLLSTFPIAHSDLEKQFKDILRHGLGGERLLSKGPYVFLNRPFEQGPGIEDLIQEKELNLHPALKGIFPYESLHKHQELAIRSIKLGKHTIVSTGTGSGKTEAFLLPIVDYCLHLREEKAAPGIVAIIVYPMNALVNDQLKRMRIILAGTGVRFARYTGETPNESSDNIPQIKHSRAYTKEEIRRLNEDEDFMLLPWEECCSRSEILDPVKIPRILLTNYNQLEYLLLRDKDIDLFRNAPLKFMVLDEIHTYTGELGSEVSCLVRRIRHVARKKPEEVICIGTSATISNNKGKDDPERLTREFAHRLFGIRKDKLAIITEVYKKPDPLGEMAYIPIFPEDPEELLSRLLNTARATQLKEEVEDIPDDLLSITEELCGRKSPNASTNMDRLYNLLKNNRLVYQLGQIFSESRLIGEILERVKSLGDRKNKADNDLICEVIAYLTVGALAQKDGEPLLRPKLHYFVSGLQGIWGTLETDGIKLYSSLEKAQSESDSLPMPLILCKSCGQHYFKLFVESDVISGETSSQGYQKSRAPMDKRDVESIGEEVVYITDDLVSMVDEEGKPDKGYICRYCGTLHERRSDLCQNDKCRRKGTESLAEVFIFHYETLTQCPSCGSPQSHLVPTNSSEVYDVHILAQSLLGAMPEKELQKLIVFADSRQDAAFQAGWMAERSKRFRLRHLLYSILEKDKEKIWSLDKLTEEIVEEAIRLGMFKRLSWGQEDDETQVKWFLLEEFGTVQQRRIGVENLGLAKLIYHGLDIEKDPDFFSHWASLFGLKPEDLLSVIRLILDYYRRRGTISDPLFQRSWSYQDKEVRKGIIQVQDHWYPKVLVLNSLLQSDNNKRYTSGLIATNGRSGAQLIISKAVSDKIRNRDDFGQNRDGFLEALWEIFEEKELFVKARLKRRTHDNIKQITISEPAFQINVDKIGVQETEERFLCSSCRRSHATHLPTNKCTEYNCKGMVTETTRDLEHFDVYQYTQMAFVPLKSWEHSAQIPPEKRIEVEQEFKKKEGKYNCIVCTPTLELGVDIGQLEMVLMRNAPPSTSNYEQRSGRAGRRHRIATVFTYCRGNHHDQYFFEEPEEMIKGLVKVPAFSLQNEPLIKKHIHSTVLTALRELLNEEQKAILNKAFPAFILSYIGYKYPEPGNKDKFRFKYYQNSLDFSDLLEIIGKNKSKLEEVLREVFYDSWPDDDKSAVNPNFLSQTIDAFSSSLTQHTNKFFNRVTTFRNRVKELNQKAADEALSEEEEKERKSLEIVIKAYLKENRDNYSLSYLARDGFLPGYALSREGVYAQCIDPFIELRRPVTIAIRELTPSNFVYANKNVFRIGKINFRQFGSSQTTNNIESYFEPIVYDRELDRVFDIKTQTSEGGSSRLREIEMCRLLEVELYGEEKIDDRKMSRRRVAFNIYGIPLQDHHGGEAGKINQKEYLYLSNQKLCLINIGPTRVINKDINKMGFPLCPICGAVRDPFMSDSEIDRFIESHKKSCSINSIKRVALKTEFRSETLKLGPYEKHDQAVNAFEGIRLGAGEVLDMGQTEVDGFIETDENEKHWIVFYDPVPGGSGFIPQIMKYWNAIIEAGIELVTNCPRKCEDACYSCLLHFRNQQFHAELNRFTAEAVLTDLLGNITKAVDIPPKFIKKEPEPGESDAEDKFIDILKRKSFPLPEGQYRVDFSGGGYTVADFAYPEKKVLIYIDGMSEKIHGKPDQIHKDSIIRAKLRMMGFQVMEITAVSLNDNVIIHSFFEELGMYLT